MSDQLADSRMQTSTDNTSSDPAPETRTGSTDASPSQETVAARAEIPEPSEISSEAEDQDQAAAESDAAAQEADAEIEASSDAELKAVAEDGQTATPIDEEVAAPVEVEAADSSAEEAAKAGEEEAPDSQATADAASPEEPVAAGSTEKPEAATRAEEPTSAEESVAAHNAEEPDSAEESVAASSSEEPANAEDPVAASSPEEPAGAEKPVATDKAPPAISAQATSAEADASNEDDLKILHAALKDKSDIEGQVIGWNKGGYHVAIGRTAAFCPVSQIEIGNPRSPKKYLDKSFRFRVIEIQRGGRRIVVSRAAVLEADREARAKEIRDRLQPGANLEGTVSSLTDFGAFVDLGGGIEGLVHVSEISRRRVEHPKEALQKGQSVKVTVLKVEKNGDRISLSMKRLEEDPWKGIAERFNAGDAFEGTILRKTDFGLFVEVEPGLEGLAHISRLPLDTTLESEELEVGKTIKGWIHEVESKRRRLSLSLREVASENPWNGISERYPVGSITKGTVERLAPFGAFIELEPGLTGLLPFSALSSPPGANPKRRFHAGREVSVKILSIDRTKRRISLGTESSQAEGTMADYKEYMRDQNDGSGLNAMAAAFAKLKGG